MRIAWLFVLALAGTTLAQPAARKTPTPQDLEEARAHFKAAEAAKARGDFKTAAVEYLAAYERFEDPEFFFNVAEVYRLSDDEKTALTYYTKYLELEPNGRAAAVARAAADDLRRSIAAKEDAAKKMADDVVKPKTEPTVKPPPAPPKPTGQPDPDDDDVHVTAATSPGRSLRIAGVATAGAGVALLGSGVVFGLKARSISNEASTWNTFDQARYNDGKRDQTTMYILTGVGGAALVTGGVLYYLGYRAARETHADATAFVPDVGPGHVGLVARGHF